MEYISINQLVAKNEISSIVQSIVDASDAPICIQDLEEGAIVRNSLYDINCSHRFPIIALDHVIGWVKGNEKVGYVADLLGHLAKSEVEKKSLAVDALEKIDF
jgi:hypothetical protein